MAASAPLSPLNSSTLSLKPIPPSTYEYDSGFSQESFLAKDFDVTSFINQCSAKISQMVHEDFNKTLDLIGDDIKQDSHASKEEEDSELSSFAGKHLTATNLKQLHNDVSECYENLKQELIQSFEANYPQFLALNQSLTAGTETNLKQCQQSLDAVHKKYNAIYEQMVRLLERIHSKSVLKSNYISKLNTLKQISFVANMMEDVKQSLKTLHNDFDPFVAQSHAYNDNQNDAIRGFKQQFCDQISSAAPRKQYRLLQKSCRLERIAILLTKLSAILLDEQEHLLVKNAEPQMIALRTRFYNELRDVLLCSIRSGSLLSLRSNLRCYNYLALVSVEEIVRQHYMKPLIYSCLPMTIFTRTNKESNHKQTIALHFDKLYSLLVDKLSILFSAEVLSQNDFIGDAIWCEVIDVVLNDDYAECFISRGLPDMLHAHYTGIMSFFHSLQRLYYTQMTCWKSLEWQCNYDQYLYYHAASRRLRKKCNLSQYFLFRMPYITRNVMQMTSGAYASLQYHFAIYMMYYEQMKGIQSAAAEEEHLNEYMKRLNRVKNALSDLDTTTNQSNNLSLKHFEYNYALPIFQVAIIHLLQCWDANRIWIWELSSDFLKLSLQILSFLCRYVTFELNSTVTATLMVLTHSDLYYFCEWLKHEFVALVEQRCGGDHQLVSRAMHPLVDRLCATRDELLNERMARSIVGECEVCLVEVDELADSWQANINLPSINNEPVIAMQKVSDYVSALLKPLQLFLMFVNDHAIDHWTVQHKNQLIWNVLNAISHKYWHKIQNVQQRLHQIQKIMQRRRRYRKKNKSQMKNEASEDGEDSKSGAQRAQYQLFLDVRQFMQQMQGFVNGLQRDEKRMRDKMEQERQEKQKQRSSSIIVFKNKQNKSNEDTSAYKTENLLCWSDFSKFVDQFQ
eukprot:181802_1